MTSIGERIKEFRAQTGISQDQLSAMLAAKGIAWSPVTVSKVETGNRRVLADEVVSLCDVLGVYTSDLLDEQSFYGQVLAHQVREAEQQMRRANAEKGDAIRQVERAQYAVDSATRALEEARRTLGEHSKRNAHVGGGVR